MLLGTISNPSGEPSFANASALTVLSPHTVRGRAFCAARVTVARGLRGHQLEPSPNLLISRSTVVGARIAPITSKSERRLR
jgi:hypothetical protein